MATHSRVLAWRILGLGRLVSCPLWGRKSQTGLKRLSSSSSSGSVVNNLPAKARDMGSIPGWRKSPGEGNGNLFQYSCLGNLKDRGAYQAIVHGVAKESDMT